MEELCEGCDEVKPADNVEAVQMSLGRGMNPPEYAYLCEDCRAELREQHAETARAEQEVDF